MLIVLIGNKVDLNDRRQVSTEEGRQFARQHNLVFFETSALNAEGVEEAFTTAAREVYDGIITSRFDTDDQGQIVGVKPGNVQLTAA